MLYLIFEATFKSFIWRGEKIINGLTQGQSEKLKKKKSSQNSHFLAAA